MKTAIRKIGNSYGVIIPKLVLAKTGAKAGDKVDVAVRDGKIVLTLWDKSPRSGWAADSQRLAAAGQGNLCWSGIANDGDENLTW